MLVDNASSLVLETALISMGRGALFLACRKYLLHYLYHDLQKLSSASQHEDPNYTLVSADIELDTLPPPTPSTPRPQHVRQLHSTLSRGTFSLCFSEVCTLFILIMCEALGVLDPSTRLLNWRISLLALLTTILVLVPLSLSVVLNFGSLSGRSLSRPSAAKVLLTLAPIGLYIWLLSFVPIPPALLSSSDYIMGALARLTVLGTLILGLLSGLGATQAIWGLLKPKAPVLSVQAISDTERSVMRVRDDIASKKRELRRFQDAEPENEQNSWLSRMVPNIRGDSESSALAKEIDALETLNYNMTRDWQRQVERHEEARAARTPVGALLGIASKGFAAYCVVRIFSSIYNLLIGSANTPKTSSPDMITHLLATAISFMPSLTLTQQDVASISKAVSLAAVGGLILSSLRVVLRGVTRLLRVTSRSLGASCMMFVLAQLMGIYLLSTLVQLNTLLPNSSPGDILEGTNNTLLSTLPHYHIFGSHFDWSLLISASLSLGARWFGNLISA